MKSINRVLLTGNLTKDPELAATPGGTAVCKLRLAVNESVKDKSTGEWSDRANYFSVDVFGATAERAAQWLTKGSHVVIDGRLRWREWETNDGGKREAVSVIVDQIEFPPKASGGSTPKEQMEAAGIPVQEADDNPFDRSGW